MKNKELTEDVDLDQTMLYFEDLLLWYQLNQNDEDVTEEDIAGAREMLLHLKQLRSKP